jgi:ppGpp synthetase/RelA/SpoT-type nucleotidyltranferase
VYEQAKRQEQDFLSKYKHIGDDSTQASKEQTRLKELNSIKAKLMGKSKKAVKKNLGYTINDSDLGTRSTTALKRQFETCTIEPKQ